ncbi:hypothetical protein [uncultured Thiodictyon sp.]|jgi:Fic family protein|uniref:hypothetical protein n=1 Tax=uncultured Thiodictyon sp. TaxID=1846217 RepID=UPI0025E4AE1F|nr:hypothetical protein [uncultured Thiodictyon sp.]
MHINDLKAFAGLDPDLRRALLAQVRDLWTHGSTALEGNTLTLGETKFVIEEGLTVSGKPLKDHQEVMGHARAIWDGNGRMARLLASVPILRSGHLPLVIDVKDRKRYIDSIAEYQLAAGPLRPPGGVWPRPELEAPFRDFCRDAYAATRALVAQAQVQQAQRMR